MTRQAKVIPIADEAPQSPYDDASRATIEDFKAELETSTCSVAQASREIGEGASQSVLSLWMREQYEGDVAAVTARVRRWLETRRESAERSTAGIDIDRRLDFECTRQIQGALAIAQARGDLVVVYGPSGTGKTRATRHYCESRAGVYRVLMSPDVRSIAGLLATVAEAIGEGDEHKSAMAARKTIVKRLQGRGALLVVDEAHDLTPALMSMLRRIRDLSGAGVAFVGEEGLERLVYKPPHRRGPIVGRVARRVALSKETVAGDVRLLAESVLGRDPGDAELQALVNAVNSDGGLHVARRLLEAAYDIARARGRGHISEEDVLGAAKAVAL